MDFTGYNIAEVNSVLLMLKSSYNDLGDKMANPWPALQNTMQEKWIGPDEQAYEGKFAKDICDLYVTCKETIQTLIDNVTRLGQSWEEFQKTNVIEDTAVKANGNTVLAEVRLDDNKLAEVLRIVSVKERNFGYMENLGLSDPLAYYAINRAIETYVNDVKNEVNKLYQGITASKAFLGGKQAQEIDAYIVRIGVAVGNLSTSHDQIREALLQLVNNYYRQAEAVNNAASGAGQQ